MVISSNILAMNAQRQFGINTDKKKKTTEKLSSGYKINRAADDAAGLTISEKLRRQIRGLDQGARNTQDGISLLQVADGALSEVHDMLHRINELSIKSANDTNTNEDRAAIQQEVDQILSEIDRISDTTEFNTRKIFTADGSSSSISIDPTSDKYKVKQIQNSFSVSGTPTNLTEGVKTISASTQGIVIDGNSVGWSSFKDSSNNELDINNISGGTFNLNYNGLKISFTVDSEDTLDNIYHALDGATFNVDKSTSMRRFVDYSNSDYNIINYGGSFLSFEIEAEEAKIPTEYGFLYSTISADTAGIKIYSAKGNLYNSFDWSTAGIQDINNPGGSSISIDDHVTGVVFTWALTPEATKDNLFQLMNFQISKDYTDEGTRYTFGINILVEDENYTVSNVKTKAYNPVSEDGSTDETETNSLWIQSGAEPDDGMYITIGVMNKDTIGLTDIDVSTADGARDAIDKVKTATNKISEMRSSIGAQQNRLEHTYRNVTNIAENTQAAESRIRDTDMATEMVELSKHNILEQVGTSMITQANQSNQGVLNLLQ